MLARYRIADHSRVETARVAWLRGHSCWQHNCRVYARAPKVSSRKVFRVLQIRKLKSGLKILDASTTRDNFIPKKKWGSYRKVVCCCAAGNCFESKHPPARQSLVWPQRLRLHRSQSEAPLAYCYVTNETRHEDFYFRKRAVADRLSAVNGIMTATTADVQFTAATTKKSLTRHSARQSEQQKLTHSCHHFSVRDDDGKIYRNYSCYTYSVTCN